jgi:hypothetical protein
LIGLKAINVNMIIYQPFNLKTVVGIQGI